MIKKIGVLLLLMCLLTGTARAEDVMRQQAENYGADGLEESLPPDAEMLMREFDPQQQAGFFDGVLSMLRQMTPKLGAGIKAAVRSMLRVLVIVVLCQLLDSVSSEYGKTAVSMTGTLAIVACCAADVHTMVGLGKSTVAELSGFTAVLLPVMASAAAASGAVTGAGAIYAVAVLFSDLLMRLCNDVLVPATYAYLGLAMADAVLQQERLSKLRDLIGWLIEKGMKLTVFLFTGFLTLTGILTGAADSAALKATKATISGVVPVVGGMISDAAQTVLAGASYLKSAIGTYGMLALLAVFLMPFLSLALSHLMFKGATALSGVLQSRQTGLLEALSNAMGYLLGMTGSCALLGLAACCCFLKAVQI